jgi:signal transduction histidine kinase
LIQSKQNEQISGTIPYVEVRFPLWAPLGENAIHIIEAPPKMNATNFNISFNIHDIKNYIGAAISRLQMVSIEHEGLEDNVNIAASIDALWFALDLAREIAVNDKASRPVGSSSEYITMSVTEHVVTNTKPFIDELRKIYSAIAINDAYQPNKEDKYISINAKSFNQAMGNIIGNAVNAGASVIDIHTVMRTYCLVITIHDNGSGMSSEEVDKIMLSQFGDGKSCGIGTKSILITAAEHDFPLTYSSVEGEGTTIRILIPYIKAQQKVPIDGAATAPLQLS